MGRFTDIDILQYIHLNYISGNVIHEGKGKIIPFRGAHVELGENSRLILHDDSLEIGLNKVKGSRTETLVRLRKNSSWDVKGYCGLSYGTTIEINANAVLDSMYFTANSHSVIVANEKITIGNDVMLGRNVVIYDSDFHTLNSKKKNSEPVVIGNHVWVATNAMILRGVHVENGSVIAAGSVIVDSVPEKTVVASETKQIILSDKAEWKR